MLFVSYQFLCFLAVVVLLFYCVPKKYQVACLLLASYCFYFYAGKEYIPYLLITTISTYFIAKNISKQKEADKQKCKLLKKRWLVMGLFINLGLLCVFKYTNFMLFNINSVIEIIKGTRPLNYFNIILPLGISFYTFQSIGYLIDVYRGKYVAENNFLRVALFLAFFPQLIQGPISRYDEIGSSLFTEKEFNQSNISSGLQRILWGYFKKLVVADRILVAVNEIIRNPAQYQGTYVLLGALFYAVELYADFTGGIDITIGIGELFGIRIAENFKQPFRSKTVKEYWTRWHISMGTWFKEYVFYPVSVCNTMKKITSLTKKCFGKSIGKKFPVYASSFFVWFLTGLWHGASWNFIAWGLGNFFIIVISEECKPVFQWFHKKFPKVITSGWFGMFQIFRTILLMSFLRMFDCYKTVSETVKMFISIFTKWDSYILFNGSLLSLGLTKSDYFILFIGILLMSVVSSRQEKGSVRSQISTLAPGWRFCIWYGLFLVVLLFGAYGVGYDATQFIYNQY